MRTDDWENNDAWTITTTEVDFAEFTPYQTGNGRIGVRVGALLLDWNGEEKKLLCEDGPDFWGQLNARLLMSLAKHAYDGGDQIILPAWNQLRLEIAGVEYGEANGRHTLRHSLDLRNGEAVCEDQWEYLPGHTVTVHLRLVVPRSHPCAAWYEVSLQNLKEPARIRFGLNAAQVDSAFSKVEFHRDYNSIFGNYTTRRQGRSLAQYLRWELEGWEEGSFVSAGNSAWISLTAEKSGARLVLVQSVHSSTDAPDPGSRAWEDLNSLDPKGRGTAVEISRQRWKEIWSNALDFRHPNQLWERLVLVNQFHLLVNLEEKGGYPLSPLGLSRPGWHGAQMWDADFWVFRALLPLWPELARNLVRFRRATLEAARTNAKVKGLRGAAYPGAATDEGADLTRFPYSEEIHVNGWVARAAWESVGSPPDITYLAEVAWPVLEGIADFFVSRAERDADGSWHLRKILPPDESVGEAPRTSNRLCDDNVLTNTVARGSVRYALEAARLLGREAPPEWADLAANIVLLPPGPDGIIPEYSGYSGHIIKQADLILSFYPWRPEADRETVLRNLEFYHEKTDRGGPLMTTQIEALLTMQYGDRQRGLEHLFREYLRYLRGPHFIPFETPANSNSIMLTGIGGLLQALIYGWYAGSDAIPRKGESWKIGMPDC